MVGEKRKCPLSFARSSASDIIELDVRGKKIKTTLTTLCKYADSGLAAMVRYWDDIADPAKEPLFIDRDPGLFKKIMHFLSSDLTPSQVPSVLLRREMDYYGLPQADGMPYSGYFPGTFYTSRCFLAFGEAENFSISIGLDVESANVELAMASPCHCGKCSLFVGINSHSVSAMQPLTVSNLVFSHRFTELSRNSALTHVEFYMETESTVYSFNFQRSDGGECKIPLRVEIKTYYRLGKDEFSSGDD